MASTLESDKPDPAAAITETSMDETEEDEEEASDESVPAISGIKKTNPDRRRTSLVNSGPVNYHIPDDVKQKLTDFAVAYLLYKPENIDDFGIEFFHNLKEQQVEGSILAKAQEKFSAVREDGDSSYKERRKTICAEPYNPEDDKDFKFVVHPKDDWQRERLLNAIKHNLLFRELDQDQLSHVLNSMYEKSVTKGEIILKQGDDGDNFYVIEHGSYSVLFKPDGAPEEEEEKVVGGFEDEGSFGEISLMYNEPRSATVRADSDGILWVMDRNTFRQIVLRGSYVKLNSYQQLLEKVPMFKDLSNYEKMKVADSLTSHLYSPGQIIIRQGEKADGMYFVEHGSVLITREQDGVKKEVARIETGGCFGELALVTNKPRAASAVAAGHVKVAFLDVEAFERLLGPCLEVMKRNAESYGTQLTKLFGTDADLTDIRWQ